MLRILLQYSKPIRNLLRLVLLLLSEACLKLFLGMTLLKLRVANSISKTSVARDDVPVDNFLQAFKLLVTDDQDVSNRRSSRLITLLNVHVDNVVSVELPSQSDVVYSF